MNDLELLWRLSLNVFFFGIVSKEKAKYESKTAYWLIVHLVIIYRNVPIDTHDHDRKIQRINEKRYMLLHFPVGTKFEGKEVVSAKRFLTDDLFGSSIDGSSVCLDCCGSHPCCHDCGLGG